MRIQKYILLMMGALLLAACSKETIVEGSQRVEIQVNVAANTRGTPESGSAIERKIERIRVMVFSKKTGRLDTQSYLEEPGGFTSIPINLNLTVIAETKIFCVIANEPASLTVTLDGIYRLDDLKTLTLADELTYNVPGSLLPMTLIKEEYIDPARAGSDPVELPIVRLVGKVRMSMTNDPSNPYPVTLQSVQVVNAPVMSRLMAGNPIDTSIPANLTDLTAQTTFLPTSDVTVATPIKMDSLYLYENHWGKTTPSATQTTGLEIKILMKSMIQTYRVYLIDDYDAKDKVYAVRRNTIADMKIRVAEAGIDIEYTIMPWEDEEYEKEPGDYDGPVVIEEWVTPTEEEHILPE